MDERRAQPGPGHAALRIRAGWLSLAVGCLIFAGKLAAWLLTGSSAVFSDAMESVVNVTAALLLVYTLRVAARPADRDHPYGHGKVEYFSAGAEGALIAAASVAILVESVRELLRGPVLQRLDAGLLMIAGLTVANGLLGAWLVRTGRRTRSLALEADGHHLLTDVFTSVGVLVGLAAVRVSGVLWLDPVVAIAVGLNILRTGWMLVRRSVGGLMDEADADALRSVVSALETQREPWCIDVHGLRAWSSGAIQHVDLHLCVPRYFDAERLHGLDSRVTAIALDALGGGPGDVLIHFDPCRPRHCSGCAMEDCPVRAAPLRERVRLTLERAVRDDVAAGEAPEPAREARA